MRIGRNPGAAGGARERLSRGQRVTARPLAARRSQVIIYIR